MAQPDASINKEMIELLKNNGKGWNAELFDDVKDAVCQSCSHVCCDAVELDCNHNHNDNEIYSYCAVCMDQLIKGNNGKCPINSHSNPVIHSVRFQRRQTMKYMVLCPYSVSYKLNIKQIIDTNNGDQNEGAQNDNNNPNASNIDGCSFHGTLNDLINTHFIDCCNEYNPMYAANIILKRLKKENKEQLLIINKIETENKSLNIKINELQKSNKLLINTKQQLIDAKVTIKELEQLTEQIVCCIKEYQQSFANKYGNVDNDQKLQFDTMTKEVLHLIAANNALEKDKNAISLNNYVPDPNHDIKDQINDANDDIKKKKRMKKKKITVAHATDCTKEYLHLTASVVKMKFPQLQYITSEELIKKVGQKYQFFDYHDKMVMIMKTEQRKLREKEKKEKAARNAALPLTAIFANKFHGIFTDKMNNK